MSLLPEMKRVRDGLDELSIWDCGGLLAMDIGGIGSHASISLDAANVRIVRDYLNTFLDHVGGNDEVPGP